MIPMQRALGLDWAGLPKALQAHHSPAPATDRGHLDITYPSGMRPVLWLLAHLGALVSRRGQSVATTVAKHMAGERQHWQRTMVFADGEVLHFNSVWVPSRPGCLIEYVNPYLGLEMQATRVGQQIHYRGLRFILQIGRRQLTVPQWLGPGATHIVEAAIDEQRFEMDFRLTHPWFGQVFRYAGRFTAAEAGPSSRAG